MPETNKLGWTDAQQMNPWYQEDPPPPADDSTRRKQIVEAENMATGLRHDYESETDPQERARLFGMWKAAFALWQRLTKP